MDLLFQLLIVALACGLGWWAFTTIMATIPLPPPVRAILTVIAVIAMCMLLFRAFGLWHAPVWR